jgi:hypothetical protein
MAVSEHSARYAKLVSELAGALDGALIDAMARAAALARPRCETRETSLERLVGRTVHELQ